MYRHRRKSIVGEAVQFTEDGKSDAIIASWFGVHPQRIKETDALSAHTLNGAVRRVERGGSRKGFGGDWLIRTKSGGLYVCPEADFESHYVKTDGYEPPKPPPLKQPTDVPPVPDEGFPSLLPRKRKG